jgi:putative methyltransferase
LGRFQFKILSKALSDFPVARYVVYSTCSVYQEENEQVVLDVLKKQTRWRTVDLSSVDSGMAGTYARGLHFNNELRSLRVCGGCGPKNYLNGFFLALFERVDE